MSLQQYIRKSFTNDLTTCSIPRGILGLAIPMITASVFQSIQSLVDMFFVGKLGAAAVASVGMAGMILMLLTTVFIGINTAVVAMIARSIGAGDEGHANHFAGQSLILTIFFSIAIGIIGYLASEWMLQGLGGKAEVVELGTGYLHISFIGIFFLAAMFVLNGILNGAGDAVTPLLLGILTTVCNIILNPIMIFGLLGFPEMGVDGSALATVIARIVTFIIGLAVLLRGNLRVHIRLINLNPDLSAMWKIFTISLPSSLQMGTRTLMNVLLMSIAAKFGTAVVAAYTVGFRIRMITLFPTFGFGGSAATMVGQNLGAKLPRRSRNSALAATGMALVVTGTAGAITFF
ncbi:MAG: MATE family efflux transporter, partial [Planctomycetes bacterium]|nr:MATE family efflux transporter [Planctomycetota bacterium]